MINKKLLLATLWLFSITLSYAAEKKPNVIFILTDDQGWGDTHFAGHPYVKTPNLDKFASQSTWFKQFYVAAAVCSPSRAAFMTGRFPARDQILSYLGNKKQNAERSMPDWLDTQVPTVASLLKSAGYATAHFGKWHLSGGQGSPPPEAYGFDVSKTVHTTGPKLGDEKAPYFRAKSTELIVDDTIQFIREHKNGPFYVNVWTLLPHAKLEPTPEQLAVYENLSPNANDPAFGPWMRKYLGNAKDLKSQMQIFCASLTDLDTQLGRLFTALEEMKLENDTIIFFASDNGPADYRIPESSNAGVGSTGPMRARKFSMYEGGIRTFGLVRWPGRVPAGKRDETSVTGGVDFLPTICKLAGVSLPKDWLIDGEDMSNLWLGQPQQRSKPLYWEWLFDVPGGKESDYLPPMVAVREGPWKLVVNHDGSDAELFDIPHDIGEEHNLASTHPDVVKNLTAKAQAWTQSLPPNPVREKAIATGEIQSAKPRQKRPKEKGANNKPAADSQSETPPAQGEE